MKNKYEIRGKVTVIFLKRKSGEIIETLIDTSDLEKVKEFPNTWHASRCKGTNSFYTHGHLTVSNKKKHTSIHRWITESKQGLVVDHINHDTLDNRRDNLRVVTHGQNQQNRKSAKKDSETGVRGVSFDKRFKKWVSRVGVNGKRIYLGTFENIKEAENAVIEARKKLMPYSTDETILNKNSDGRDF